METLLFLVQTINREKPDMKLAYAGPQYINYELYDVTAKHLRKRFPNIKIGGYASCGFSAIVATEEELEEKPWYLYQMDFFHGFMQYIKEHHSPIDFFSYHSYSRTNKLKVYDQWLHEQLVNYGYGEIETHLNEWNPVHSEKGTGHHAAEVTAAMLALQNGHADMLMYYDTRVEATAYGGFFAPFTKEPTATYYSFVAFGKLYELGTQTEAVVDCDAYGLYAVSATDGKNNALMIANRTGELQELNIEGVDLSNARYHIIDKNHLLSMSFDAKSIAKDTVLLIEW